MFVADVSYHRSGRVLRVVGGLGWPVDIRFDIEVRALLDDSAARGSDVVVDLRDVTAIGSQYVGALAAAAVEVGGSGRSLTVRARGGEVAASLKRCRLDKVALLEIG